jgi:NADPH2:quinone reductase
MKALVSKAPGLPETLVLENLPSPEPGPDDVVIAVKAVGVNYPDVLIIQDMYQFKPDRPFAPGGEVAGVVKAVGTRVTTVKIGDRVIGSTGWGGMAEEALVNETRVTPIPDAMPFDEASAFLMTGPASNLERRFWCWALRVEWA